MTTVVYRLKMIAHMQAVGLLKGTQYDGTEPSESELRTAHGALSVYLLGVSDTEMPSQDAIDLQQYLNTLKKFDGPLDAHWSAALGTAMHAVFDPLNGSLEMGQMRDLMYDRQASILRDAWLTAVAGLPVGSLRLHGAATDGVSVTYKWRILLLDASATSVYDTHAAAGYNAGNVGTVYSSRPEVQQAVQTGWGYSTRTGTDYGPTETVNYIACAVSVALPYRYLLFSRPAV